MEVDDISCQHRPQVINFSQTWPLNFQNSVTNLRPCDQKLMSLSYICYSSHPDNHLAKHKQYSSRFLDISHGLLIRFTILCIFLMKQNLHPIKKWLFISITIHSLLSQWIHSVRKFSTISRRVRCWKISSLQTVISSPWFISYLCTGIFEPFCPPC